MLCLHLPVHYFPAETKVGVIISLRPPASAGGNAPLNGNAHPMNNVSTSDKTTCTFMNTLCNLFGKLHPSRHTQVAGGPSVADGGGIRL